MMIPPYIAIHPPQPAAALHQRAVHPPPHGRAVPQVVRQAHVDARILPRHDLVSCEGRGAVHVAVPGQLTGGAQLGLEGGSEGGVVAGGREPVEGDEVEEAAGGARGGGGRAAGEGEEVGCVEVGGGGGGEGVGVAGGGGGGAGEEGLEGEGGGDSEEEGGGYC